MTKVIYNKTTGKVIGKVLTNRCMSFEDVLDILGAEWLEIEDYGDPDVLIDGKKYYCDDLGMRTEK